MTFKWTPIAERLKVRCTLILAKENYNKSSEPNNISNKSFNRDEIR